MNKPEIVANLWYVMDEQGFIYEVRGRMYIVEGSDDEKLRYLHQFTHTDYMISPSRPLPQNVKSQFEDGTYNVIHYEQMRFLGGEGMLFSELFDEMEASIPSDALLAFPPDPLTVITPLSRNEAGILMPYFTKTEQNPKGA